MKATEVYADPSFIKLIIRFSFIGFITGFIAVLIALVSLSANAAQQVYQDYHLTTYMGPQENVSDIELFTKQSEREVFFGITCSTMTPFPLVQILLFNDEVLSETPKFLSVSYSIDGQVFEFQPALQGILEAVNKPSERANKIRLELVPSSVDSFALMGDGYLSLLENLKLGRVIEITLKSGSFGSKAYRFSLNGLNTLLEPHKSICR